MSSKRPKPKVETV